MGKLVGIGAAVAAAGLLVATPNRADACGGTFCDAGPTMGDPMSMQIDQTGETVVFAFDETHVEAHVQINYDPDTPAERFAWIVPVMAVPEISVGSQALFTNLQNATAPSYGYVDFFDSCGGGFGDDGDDWGGGGGGWCDGGDEGGAAGGTGGDGFGDDGGEDGGTDGGGTQVVAQATVGAFDYVLLQSETVPELMEWLKANDYYADPNAEEVFGEYLAEGAMFAAFKLTNGAAIGEIHPITIRYEGEEPCIPIRLTRVAAQDDMDIRVFFLGERRAFPTNYRHVEINPLKLDWVNLAENYKEVVSLAVDSEGADGHAFLTEYFGPTADVSNDGLSYPLLDPQAFKDVSPFELLPAMEAQGLLNGCTELDGCDWQHPLAQSIVATVLPVPEGVEPNDFYACVECYEELIDPLMFDATNVVEAVDERILRPAQRATELLATNPNVTRLYTTLSPHEMTEDPMFHQSDSDSEQLVDHRNDIQTRDNACNGRRSMTMLDGRFVDLPDTAWPDIEPDEMPWVELVSEHVAGMGAPVVLVDNATLIDELLVRFNSAAAATRPGFRCEDEFPDDPGADGGEDGSASGGCGCRTPGDRGSAGWMLMALGLVVGSAARRRR